MASKCHICNAPLVVNPAASRLSSVTSDCRPWHPIFQPVVCYMCGTVQKVVSPEWLEDIQNIYSGYQVYYQGGGAEQKTFDTTGSGVARSVRIVTWLDQTAELSGNGTLLDIGCGNGAFLSAFQHRYPGWNLTGLELDSRNQDAVCRIPNTCFFCGSLQDLRQEFDLVVLIHALEHIPVPLTLLKTLATRLKPGGKLLIHVPNLVLSPFDLLIADHCTHFTYRTLNQLMASAGWDISAISTDQIPKELSVLAAFSARHDRGRISLSCPDQNNPVEEGLTLLKNHLAWLQEMWHQALQTNDQVCILGSSIAAAWLATAIGTRVKFFLDEDVNRVGKQFMGLPILSIQDVQEKIPVLMPLLPDIAKNIIGRYKNRSLQFIPPPGMHADD
ncbi:MAG: class I SAM-dependent methyltransferase [Desulfatirhabdiaceae bacterium]